MPVNDDRICAARDVAVASLVEEMRPDGYWEGELSSSALATATAVVALHVNGRDEHADLIKNGAAWLAADQNADGGWGDSPESPSNLSTTMLAIAALTLAAKERFPDARVVGFPMPGGAIGRFDFHFPQ